jgi:uncharacterized protein (DUF1697 family)
MTLAVRVHCVFLRAIGPVSHKAMPLKQLCACCEAAGLGKVQSILATGNLVLSSNASQDVVSEIVSKSIVSFGLQNEVFVRSPKELSDIVMANPFPDAAKDHPSHLVVHFMQSQPHALRLESVLSHAGPERVVAHFRELYIDYPVDIGHSKLQPGVIERKLKQSGTARNWNTTLKMLAIASERETTLQSGKV